MKKYLTFTLIITIGFEKDIIITNNISTTKSHNISF